MARLFRKAGFQRRGAQFDREACFELYGKFSPTYGTIKCQKPILVAYIPSFEESYVSESYLKFLSRSQESPTYEYSGQKEVTLFWESDSVRLGPRKGPCSFAMLFKVVIQDLPVDVILGSQPTSWAGSEKHPDMLKQASRSGQLIQRLSWTPKTVRRWLSKVDHAKESRNLRTKPPELNVKKWSNPYVEFGPEDQLSLQLKLNSKLPSPATKSQEHEHPLFIISRSTADETCILSETQPSPCETSHTSSSSPQKSTINLGPPAHVVVAGSATAASKTQKRDSALTESSWASHPSQEFDTSNYTLTPESSIDSRREINRNLHRTVQQPPEFSPIAEVPSHSPTRSRYSSKHQTSTVQPGSVDESPTTFPSSETGINILDPHPASITGQEENKTLHTSAPPVHSEKTRDAKPSASDDRKHQTSEIRKTRMIGGFRISKLATNTPEELAAARANDPFWTWDEDSERYFCMDPETNKVIWFGEGT